MSAYLIHHRRVVAVTGSVTLHLLLLLAILPSAQTSGFTAGGSVGNGMGRGEGVDLTLYEIAQPAPGSMAVKTPEAEDMEDLRQPDVAERLEAPLLELADTTFTDFATLKIPDMPSAADSTSEAEAQTNKGATGTGGLTKGAGDDLWAAIAPCWRKIVDEHTVPVTLEVTFSSGGALAEPPVIMRGDASANDPGRLVSESKAIQALAECSAYPMASGQTHVSIIFPAL
ncbi:hypothetical protein [Asticcacaulis sp. AC402]|uniref:hypothetical protein n=1 Tax=Asticcacaulis sp. AC402 TaxID=1282361 RepID=UPI0012DF9595|nr:hypothetical protein [Asticcacaulis sp. AC402]